VPANGIHRYLNNGEATTAAHDDDGWFKTGDICEFRGPFIFIVGRASVDIIKSGGYKIGAPEIEKACLGLPYVREACVLGVDDEEYGQRVATVVSLSGTNIVSKHLSIDRLRNDLRTTLPAYKLPTLLKVVEGELLKSQTGKVQKKLLGPQLFHNSKDVQVWNWNERSAKPRL
jgi:malonyl-CoA/methylmalonyl-CoA synthetase